MRSGRVVVLGAGLAGLTAACTLADEGADVTVLESRRHLGGSTFSFARTVAGRRVVLDNGQHVVLRCYQRYLALLDRIGTSSLLRLQPRLRIPVLTPSGRIGVIQRADLPAPAHMAAAIAGYRLLSPTDRIAALRAAAALSRLDPCDPTLDAASFGAWLVEQHQSPRAREALWDLITVAALNSPPDEASLALAAMVLRTAFVDSGRGGADVGVPRRPLDELHVAPARRHLEAHGGRVLTETPARAVARQGDAWSVSHDDGEIRADAVVLAVDPRAAVELLPAGAVPEPGRLRELGSSPIVSVHVWFDRPVLGVPFTAAVGSPLGWIFAPAHQEGPGQYVTAPISAARDWIDRPASQIKDEVVPALRALLTEARRAEVVEVLVTRERHATFAQRPGTAALRPPARTPLPGLALAGAWTATGWPDTIEGAVRSGEAAAAVVLEHLGTGPPRPRAATQSTRGRTG